KRVEERVKTVRTTRNLERTEEKDEHELNNTDTANVVGIYRWVDKVQRLQMFRFPHRLLLEFQIPEPATYLMWRRSQIDSVNPEPEHLIRRKPDFTPLLDKAGKEQPLRPGDIAADNYQWWVAQYNVLGV